MKHFNPFSSRHLLRVKDFSALKGYKIHFNHVSLENIKNVKIDRDPLPLFIGVRKLYIKDCDENFVKNYVNEYIFPSLKKIETERIDFWLSTYSITTVIDEEDEDFEEDE